MVDYQGHWLLVLGLLVALVLWATPAPAEGMLRVGIASNLNTLDPPMMKIDEEYRSSLPSVEGRDRHLPHGVKPRPGGQDLGDRVHDEGSGGDVSVDAARDLHVDHGHAPSTPPTASPCVLTGFGLTGFARNGE